jgi:hypothetical protein
MINLPKILCTTVIRSVKQGESHGGIYVVDLNNEEVKQVFDYNTSDIDFYGRGGSRGLRGIAFDTNKVYIAGSEELFVFDSQMKLIETFKNRYLELCHEIYLSENNLYLTSTNFDSILVFDTNSRKFIKGYHFTQKNYLKTRLYRILNKALNKTIQIRPFQINEELGFTEFNPDSGNGPERSNKFHINNVTVIDHKLFLAGVKLLTLQEFDFAKVTKIANIPGGTHNAMPYMQEFVIMNNTRKNEIVVKYISGKNLKRWDVKLFPHDELLNANIPDDHARQGFARGLAIFENYIIAGSSPANISVYDINEKGVIKTINFSKDIRITIHGLEVIPSGFHFS